MGAEEGRLFGFKEGVFPIIASVEGADEEDFSPPVVFELVLELVVPPAELARRFGRPHIRSGRNGRLRTGESLRGVT